MHRFPNEAHKQAEKMQTETNMPSLMPDSFRKWWRHRKTIWRVFLSRNGQLIYYISYRYFWQTGTESFYIVYHSIFSDSNWSKLIMWRDGSSAERRYQRICSPCKIWQWRGSSKPPPRQDFSLNPVTRRFLSRPYFLKSFTSTGKIIEVHIHIPSQQTLTSLSLSDSETCHNVWFFVSEMTQKESLMPFSKHSCVARLPESEPVGLLILFLERS